MNLNFHYNYSHEVKDTYAISMLTVNSEDLVSRGYDLLTCGDITTTEQYPLILDKEGKVSDIPIFYFYNAQ